MAGYAFLPFFLELRTLTPLADFIGVMAYLNRLIDNNSCRYLAPDQDTLLHRIKNCYTLLVDKKLSYEKVAYFFLPSYQLSGIYGQQCSDLECFHR